MHGDSSARWTKRRSPTSPKQKLAARFPSQICRCRARTVSLQPSKVGNVGPPSFPVLPPHAIHSLSQPPPPGRPVAFGKWRMAHQNVLILFWKRAIPRPKMGNSDVQPQNQDSKTATGTPPRVRARDVRGRRCCCPLRPLNSPSGLGLCRKQQEQKLATERDAMKQQQERAITEERARIESEFAKRASEIAREHEMLNSQLGQAESELLSRQQTLEKELLERSQELESVRKLVDALPP